MNIGSAIRSVRKKIGMQQRDLAERCCLSQTSLSQIENNVKRPSPKNLTRLCAVMDVPESIIYIIAMERSDVPDSKRDIYELVYPSIKSLVLQIVNQEYAELVSDGYNARQKVKL